MFVWGKSFETAISDFKMAMGMFFGERPAGFRQTDHEFTPIMFVEMPFYQPFRFQITDERANRVPAGPLLFTDFGWV